MYWFLVRLGPATDNISKSGKVKGRRWKKLFGKENFNVEPPSKEWGKKYLKSIDAEPAKYALRLVFPNPIGWRDLWKIDWPLDN